MKSILALLALSLIAPVASAVERFQSFDGVTVHYNAIPTTDLLPEVAKAYKIERSKNRGLLTVSVLQKNALGAELPVEADIRTDIASKGMVVKMKKIQEGTAIYYLGEFQLTPPERLMFTISVKPAGATEPVKVDYPQEFFP